MPAPGNSRNWNKSLPRPGNKNRTVRGRANEMSWHISVWYWLLHAALGSFLILGSACLAALVCRQPVRRLRLIELTLAGCLLVPWLVLVPGLPRWPIDTFIP